MNVQPSTLDATVCSHWSFVSVALGVIGTYAAYLQEDHFQHGNANNLWTIGIIVNSVLVAVFVLPLSAIIGVCVQRTVEKQQTREAKETK